MNGCNLIACQHETKAIAVVWKLVMTMVINYLNATTVERSYPIYALYKQMQMAKKYEAATLHIVA